MKNNNFKTKAFISALKKKGINALGLKENRTISQGNLEIDYFLKFQHNGIAFYLFVTCWKDGVEEFLEIALRNVKYYLINYENSKNILRDPTYFLHKHINNKSSFEAGKIIHLAHVDKETICNRLLKEHKCVDSVLRAMEDFDFGSFKPI